MARKKTVKTEQEPKTKVVKTTKPKRTRAPRKTQPKKKETTEKIEPNIQTVNVYVDGKTARTSAPRRRQARREPQIETISSKTLAPVFIQPPVVSQQPQYPTTLPTEMYVVPQPTGMKLGHGEKKAIVADAVTQMEDLRPRAEPLKKTKHDTTDDILFEEPVANTKDNNVPEGLGVFFNQPLKDTNLQAAEKHTASLADVDRVTPAYEEDADRDVAAYTAAPESGKKKRAVQEPRKQLINDFKLYARDESMRSLPDFAISNYIKDTMEQEGITAKQFAKQYMHTSKKQRERYAAGKYKQEQYDIIFQKSTTPAPEPITSVPVGTVIKTGETRVIKPKPKQPQQEVNAFFGSPNFL